MEGDYPESERSIRSTATVALKLLEYLGLGGSDMFGELSVRRCKVSLFL